MASVPPEWIVHWTKGTSQNVDEFAWPFSQINAPVLLHGDYWPGNILWRDEQLAAVIDWEDARLGDPLIDLAISRLDLLWIFGSEAMNSFTQDYLTGMAIDTRDLPYWDLCAALRLVRLAGANLAEWAAVLYPVWPARHIRKNHPGSLPSVRHPGI